LQRYQNVKAELEAQQNLERIRMEKLVQSGALTSVTGVRRLNNSVPSSSQGGGMKKSYSNNNLDSAALVQGANS
jgi:hypothetical protein